MVRLKRRSAAYGSQIGVVWQVHIAQGETKHSCLPERIRALRAGGDRQSRWPALRCRGLMGMATNTEDLGQVRREFEGLAALRKELIKGGTVNALLFTELSMGMSGDVEEAVAAGSTMVRIGTAIFGERG